MKIIMIISLVLSIVSAFWGVYFLGKYKGKEEKDEEIKKEYIKYKSKLKCLSCENSNVCKYTGTYSSLGCSNYIKQGSNPPISEAVKYLRPTDSFM